MRPDDGCSSWEYGAGARALLVAREQLRGRRIYCRAGNPASRRSPLPARLVRGNRRDRGVAEKLRIDLTVSAPRSPFARNCGRIRQARAPIFVRAASPPRSNLRSLPQGVLRAARHSDRRGRGLQLADEARAAIGPFRFPAVFEWDGLSGGKGSGRSTRRTRREGARTHLQRATSSAPRGTAS